MWREGRMAGMGFSGGLLQRFPGICIVVIAVIVVVAVVFVAIVVPFVAVTVSIAIPLASSMEVLRGRIVLRLGCIWICPVVGVLPISRLDIFRARRARWSRTG